MLQVVQNIRSGATTVATLPDPIAPAQGLLVETRASLISAGTERYVVGLAKSSLVSKARQRPDHVRRVLQKVREDGPIITAQQVMAKLDEPMSLGYATSGIVIECGAGVRDFKPGDRVATAGPHAGIVAVGRHLCAPIPDNVGFEDAAYTAVAAIALQAVRLAQPTLGERILVIGLGLIGQITVQILRAHGCRVLGVDHDAQRCALVQTFGVETSTDVSHPDVALRFSGGHGVDAAIITAATPSNGPIEFAAAACRTKGRIIGLGSTGLDIPRPEFFAKELSFMVSFSMGPGRCDRAYEEQGVDYPIGHARWTVQRNMMAILELMSSGALSVKELTTHTFPIENADQAYTLITGRKPSMGVLLKYPAEGLVRCAVHARAPAIAKRSSNLGLGMIGAGNFARLVLLPELRRQKELHMRSIASAKGMNAAQLSDSAQFDYATTDVQELFADPDVDVVCIATRHNTHANLVQLALRAGKHVFVEKPLCISHEELNEINECIRELGNRCPILMVGFNRRFAPATAYLRQSLKDVSPLTVSYRFATASLPHGAWPADDTVGGGRIVGEACHAIDLCTALQQSMPVRVQADAVAHGPGVVGDEGVFITIRHQNGGVSNVSYQAGGDRSGPAERAEVFAGGVSAVLEDWRDVITWRHGKRQRWRQTPDKGYRGEIDAFIRACNQGDGWPIPWEHMFGVTWASLAAVESLRTGRACVL